ncbi:MAG: hypothetical protein ABJZ55_26030 [Fuerstiella sp.]
MSEASQKKKRSPIERLIVWGLIAMLLVVVLIEYRASNNFNAAQEYLSEAVERKPTPTIDEMKARISGASIGQKQTDEFGTEEYELAFFSLFKSDTYKLRVQLLEIPTDSPELAEGQRRIAEVYAPSVAEAVRNEHDDFIKNTPHAPPLLDNGAGLAPDGDKPDSEGEADSDSTSPEDEEKKSSTGPADDVQSPQDDE